ncbi:MAG TPA: hypothetical protein VH370_13040 [Humisphaera sp.]|jgi:hypothetical protein|nr:hypothetical protein [Humisphaera sp.]
MSARDIYYKTIRPLAPIERLRIATLILDELSASGGKGLDIGDSWSDEDIADLTGYSMSQSAPAATGDV